MVKHIKKFFNNLKLNARFNLFIAALLIVIFSTLGFYLYYTQKQEIFKNSDKQLRVLLEDLINIFEVQTNMKQENVNSTLKFAEYIMQEQGSIQENDSVLIPVEVTNPVTNETRTDSLPIWYLNGEVLQKSTEFTDFIQEKGVETATILQKTSDGYVRISTNVLKKSDGSRATGTLIPNTSEVVKTIERGEHFEGRTFVVDEWFLASYVPIYIDDEIKGMLSVGEKQMDYDILKPIFYTKTYLENGYPYVVSGDGFSVINPSGIEGTDLNGSKFFHLLTTTKENHEEAFRYFWPEDPKLGQWKWTYFKYFEPLDAYIATSVLEEELFTGLTKIRNGIIWGVVISITVFFFAISLIIRPMTSSIKQLVDIIYTMSKGKMVEKIYYKRDDEIGDIINSLNTLINGLSETARFSNEIEKGNYNTQFTPLSEDDILGNALLDMRNSLKRAKEEEEKRKVEDEKRKWANEGLAMFNNILRHTAENLNDLSVRIISNVVRYLNANQGGLFLYMEEGERKYLKLLAAFAYNQEKYLSREIEYGEGLVGACAIEKESIYLTNIPDDYIEITSGMGDAAPTSLLIVPLKLNDEVFGVIEMASFNEFKQYEIDFAEKLAESIASTLATAKVNEQTAKLLEESRKQSEEMAAQEEEMRQNLEELQATQEESARNQAEMSGVVSALDASFLVSELDMEGRVISMNQPFLDMLDRTLSEVEHKTQSGLLQLDQQAYQQHLELWEQLRLGHIQSKVQHIMLEDFREFWLSETYTPIFDSNGTPYKVLNIAVDITESKKQEIEIQKLLADSQKKAKKLAAQEKLNSYNVEKLEKMQAESVRKEAELSSILDSIDNIALRGEYATDGTIITVNSNYLRKLEYSIDEMRNKDNRIFIPPEEAEGFETLWKSVLKGNKHDGIVRRLTKTGKEIWLFMSYTPVKDRHGNITKVLFLAYDITKQKLNEQRTKNHALKMLEKNKKMRSTVKKLDQVEEELKEKRHEISELMKALNKSSWLVIYDPKGTIVEVTDFALNKLKLRRDDVIGKTIKDFQLSGSEEQKLSQKKFWTDLQTGKSINEIKCKVDNGNATWLSETYTPIFTVSGNLYRIVKITHDMTHAIPENLKKEVTDNLKSKYNNS